MITHVGNELAGRASTRLVLENWRMWYFGAVIAAVSVLCMLTGVFSSLAFNDWGFLGRSGALIVVLGSYLIGRPVWRRRFKSRFVTLTLVTDGKLADEQIAEYIMERTDIWFFYIGFIIAAVGSFIWGFADLINCFDADAVSCAIPTFHHKL